MNGLGSSSSSSSRSIKNTIRLSTNGNPVPPPLKRLEEEANNADDDDDIEGDSHIPNVYDESELDSKIRYDKPNEVDYSDPLDVRNHSSTILTPMSLSIAEAVKARRGRKRSRFNDIDREYLLASFDPKLNSDMDDVDTLLRVLKRDEEKEEEEPRRDYAVQEESSDEDEEYITTSGSDENDYDDKNDEDYYEDSPVLSGDDGSERASEAGGGGGASPPHKRKKVV
jgi:hypothetical protein